MKAKVGEKVAIATPQYTYYCIVYKREKHKSRGVKVNLTIFDEYGNNKPAPKPFIVNFPENFG